MDELLKKRKEQLEIMRGILDAAKKDKRPFTEDEEKRFDAAKAEYERLTSEMRKLAGQQAREEGFARLDIDQARSLDEQLGRTRPGLDPVSPEETRRRAGGDVSPEDRAVALRAWFRSTAAMPIALETREREAAERCGLRLGFPILDVNLRTGMFNTPAEKRALSAQVVASGAALIAEGFISTLERAMLDFSGVRQAAQILRTSQGNPLPWPTSDDTSNEGALTSENTAQTDQDVAFGQIVWGAYKYSSKFVKVPYELLEDSAIDLPAVIGEILGERLGRRQNRDCTVGTGAAQPKGIVTASALGVDAAVGTAFTADELIDLEHSVDPAYRGGQGVGFMMHDKILAYVRKLKDSNARYLFTSDRIGDLGSPGGGNLRGYPVYLNQHMVDTQAVGAKTVLFGQLSKYKIREVNTIRIRRLVERFADSDQDGFIAFSRIDGNLLVAGAAVATAPVKHLVG